MHLILVASAQQIRILGLKLEKIILNDSVSIWHQPSSLHVDTCSSACHGHFSLFFFFFSRSTTPIAGILCLVKSVFCSDGVQDWAEFCWQRKNIFSLYAIPFGLVWKNIILNREGVLPECLYV